MIFLRQEIFLRFSSEVSRMWPQVNNHKKDSIAKNIYRCNDCCRIVAIIGGRKSSIVVGKVYRVNGTVDRGAEEEQSKDTVYNDFLHNQPAHLRPNNNNKKKNTRTMFMVLSSCWKQHCESSPWFTRWAQHGARWPPTFGRWTKPIGLNHKPACRLRVNYTLTITILLLLSPKADTHFTIPRRVEGWVDLVGWLHTEMVYPLAHGHPSKY